jgi:hypothetical protein
MSSSSSLLSSVCPTPSPPALYSFSSESQFYDAAYTLLFKAPPPSSHSSTSFRADIYRRIQFELLNAPSYLPPNFYARVAPLWPYPLLHIYLLAVLMLTAALFMTPYPRIIFNAMSTIRAALLSLAYEIAPPSSRAEAMASWRNALETPPSTVSSRSSPTSPSSLPSAPLPSITFISATPLTYSRYLRFLRVRSSLPAHAVSFSRPPLPLPPLPVPSLSIWQKHVFSPIAAVENPAAIKVIHDAVAKARAANPKAAIVLLQYGVGSEIAYRYTEAHGDSLDAVITHGAMNHAANCSSKPYLSLPPDVPHFDYVTTNLLSSPFYGAPVRGDSRHYSKKGGDFTKLMSSFLTEHLKFSS